MSALNVSILGMIIFGLLALFVEGEEKWNDKIKGLIPGFKHTKGRCKTSLDFYSKDPIKIDNKRFDELTKPLRSKYKKLKLRSAVVTKLLDITRWLVTLSSTLVSTIFPQLAPVIGILSWFSGAVGFVGEKMDTQVVNMIDKAFYDLTKQSKQEIDALKGYVDENVIKLERQILKGEFHQMRGVLEDCYGLDGRDNVQCRKQACSFIVRGYDKFAILNDELAERNERITLTTLEWQRIYANMPLFYDYVYFLFVPCQAARLSLEALKRDGSYKDTLEKVKTYLVRATVGLMNKLNKHPTKDFLEYGFKKDAKGKTLRLITIQCRYKMNDITNDKCTVEEEMTNDDWKKVKKGMRNGWRTITNEEEAVKHWCNDSNRFNAKWREYDNDVGQKVIDKHHISTLRERIIDIFSVDARLVDLADNTQDNAQRTKLWMNETSAETMLRKMVSTMEEEEHSGDNDD